MVATSAANQATECSALPIHIVLTSVERRYNKFLAFQRKTYCLRSGGATDVRTSSAGDPQSYRGTMSTNTSIFIGDDSTLQPSGSFGLSFPSESWLPQAVCAALAYLLVVRLLRYRRLEATFRTTKYKTRADYGSMTLGDAHSIQLALAELEFPKVFSSSVFFALFKVCTASPNVHSPS